MSMSSTSSLKVALVMPTYFDDGSVLAGGERYAHELATALSRKTPTTLFTFSKKKSVGKVGPLTVRRCGVLFYAGGIVNPVSFSHIPDLMNFDVIHCLQPRTWVTDLAFISGFLSHKKTFLTDLGGGALYTPGRFLPLHRLIHGFLPISEFNRGLNLKIQKPVTILYGGVDTHLFSPSSEIQKSRDLILHVGRIFPLKGLHLLIEALPPQARLEVVGQCHDSAYRDKLKSLCIGKRVKFLGALSDAQLVQKYREAFITVLPSLVDTGFTSSMESMACGTPVLGTRLGSLPEVVKEDVSGFLVEPNSVGALRKKIEELLAEPMRVEKLAPGCREEVLSRFTWEYVANRCLEAYQA